nr:hypothetical protein CFP56_60246 [Quercus suber]
MVIVVTGCPPDVMVVVITGTEVEIVTVVVIGFKVVVFVIGLGEMITVDVLVKIDLDVTVNPLEKGLVLGTGEIVTGAEVPVMKIELVRVFGTGEIVAGEVPVEKIPLLKLVPVFGIGEMMTGADVPVGKKPLLGELVRVFGIGEMTPEPDVPVGKKPLLGELVRVFGIGEMTPEPDVPVGKKPVEAPLVLVLGFGETIPEPDVPVGKKPLLGELPVLAPLVLVLGFGETMAEPDVPVGKKPVLAPLVLVLGFGETMAEPDVPVGKKPVLAPLVLVLGFGETMAEPDVPVGIGNPLLGKKPVLAPLVLVLGFGETITEPDGPTVPVQGTPEGHPVGSGMPENVIGSPLLGKKPLLAVFVLLFGIGETKTEDVPITLPVQGTPGGHPVGRGMPENVIGSPLLGKKPVLAVFVLLFGTGETKTDDVPPTIPVHGTPDGHPVGSTIPLMVIGRPVPAVPITNACDGGYGSKAAINITALVVFRPAIYGINSGRRTAFIWPRALLSSLDDLAGRLRYRQHAPKTGTPTPSPVEVSTLVMFGGGQIEQHATGGERALFGSLSELINIIPALMAEPRYDIDLVSRRLQCDPGQGQRMQCCYSCESNLR